MSFVRKFAAFSTSIMFLTAGSVVSAAEFQNIVQLDKIVADTIGADIGEPGGARSPIDRRLRLGNCPAAPTVEGPVFGAAIVRCASLGWRIRVPLVGETAAINGGSATSKREMLIRRGQNVTLVYKGAGFSLSRQMIADENGAIGEMIAVRRDRRSPRILAEVSGNGQVIMQAP
ncbi:flagella basal body P-ring formation protein FlgA [Parasphingorhabdus sp.]|uniref:flagella basal body P-ring formation protein FlgA n=1 Tax=Parasphingorhabdus sp. TaxID=2709688 RepID=UPI003265D011